MKKILAVLLFMACASAVCAQVPSDVPRDHWAYEAVRDLVSEGYLEGYADGAFLGNRTLTRYEFATVVKRVVDEVNSRLAAIKPAGPTTTTPAPVAGTTGAAVPSVTQQDLENVRKLTDEFKAELLVIGTRLDNVEAALGELSSTVKTIHAIVTDEEGALESTRAEVSKLKKVGVSGYVQTRYSTFQSDPDKPNTDVTDNFSIRRARLKVTGKPTQNATVVVQFDGGQGFKGDAGPTVTTKDAYIDYAFAGDPALGLTMSMGQMKWPFGYEVVESSSVRETPERSLIAQRLFPGERDRGFMLSTPLFNQLAVWRVGVFNGVETKYKDINDNKDLVSSLRFALGDLNLGVSGYFGKGVLGVSGSNPVLYYNNRDRKTRYGADLQYYMNRLTFKAEYMAGKGVDGLDNTKAFVPSALDETISGYYAQVALNLTGSDTLVAKYDSISEDPKNPTFGERTAWNLGLIRWLDDKTRLKAFYQINKEEKKEFDNNNFIFEWITTF